MRTQATHGPPGTGCPPFRPAPRRSPALRPRSAAAPALPRRASAAPSPPSGPLPPQSAQRQHCVKLAARRQRRTRMRAAASAGSRGCSTGAPVGRGVRRLLLHPSDTAWRSLWQTNLCEQRYASVTVRQQAPSREQRAAEAQRLFASDHEQHHKQACACFCSASARRSAIERLLSSRPSPASAPASSLVAASTPAFALHERRAYLANGLCLCLGAWPSCRECCCCYKASASE